ncbi:MAG: aldo/keto reductase [Opitutales bacterium]
MDLEIPRIVFGSSALGNLYEVVEDDQKLAIVTNWIRHQKYPIIDSAGKYGAGLSLEKIGSCLKALNIHPQDVTISNKLGWKRIPLTAAEPTFEPGAWKGIQHDAELCLGYDGILECFHQGNELLGDYHAELLSVHDPDEYLAEAKTLVEQEARYKEILESYRALAELRDAGRAKGLGVGSKDWTIIKRLVDDGVPLDWVMFANSFTLYTHSEEIIEFISQLYQSGITVINSSVFNAGFLIGGKWFDYREVDRESEPLLFEWRDRFLNICKTHQVSPALACCEFALSAPGVTSLALNTARPHRVEDNVSLVNEQAPAAFWASIKAEGILDQAYPYL